MVLGEPLRIWVSASFHAGGVLYPLGVVQRREILMKNQCGVG